MSQPPVHRSTPHLPPTRNPQIPPPYPHTCTPPPTPTHHGTHVGGSRNTGSKPFAAHHPRAPKQKPFRTGNGPNTSPLTPPAHPLHSRCRLTHGERDPLPHGRGEGAGGQTFGIWDPHGNPAGGPPCLDEWGQQANEQTGRLALGQGRKPPYPHPHHNAARAARPPGIPAGAVAQGCQLGGTHTQAHACHQLHTAGGRGGHSGMHHNTPLAVESVGPCPGPLRTPPARTSAPSATGHEQPPPPAWSGLCPAAVASAPKHHMVHSGCIPRAEQSGGPQRPDPHTHKRSTSYRSVWQSHLGRDHLWCTTVVTDSSTAGNGGCPVSTRGANTAQHPPPCSKACGRCPMPGRALPCLWVVPYAGRSPPMLVGGALCQTEPSHACGWCPMPGGALPCLWVVPYAGRSPPMLVGGALCRAEPSHACGWCPMPGRALPCLWVVPYAGRSPPMLVGGALCQAEPSHACGWCPMPGGALPCLWVVLGGTIRNNAQ